MDAQLQLGPIGNVFYFTERLDEAVEWYAARLGRRPVFTGERLCQLLDPFGNLSCIRQEPSPATEASPGDAS